VKKYDDAKQRDTSPQWARARTSYIRIFALSAPLLGACSAASPADRSSDAGPKNDTGADAAPDASAGADAPTVTPVPVFTLDAGVTWTALYRDYFGPIGVASCAGNGNCHGSTSELGYMVSSYLCPPTKAACYAGITSMGDGGADLIAPDASFGSDYLSQVLCQTSGVGQMPLYCSYTFTAVDIQRIQDWIAAGRQDN
jgi:hypothetical protein